MKQQPHSIEQWEDLSRHFSKVTLGQMLRYFFGAGRIAELNKEIPVIFPEDNAGRAWRKVMRGLAVRLRQWPERLYWRFVFQKVNAHYKEPAKIRWPNPAPEFLPHEDPRINNYAHLIDWFASEYGWSEKQIKKVRFAAINEYILAAEFRKVRERADLANATNLHEGSQEILGAYPKRWHELTGEEREMVNKLRYKQRMEARGG